jgi:aryl-alcohol dehydrogenase-like predicted oxidoreductase
MEYIQFGDTGIRVSRLGFGCGPMGSRFSAKESGRALEVALDSGITLFDTARAYGYGDAEAILGQVMRGRRDKIVISTKFGMQAGSARAGRSSTMKRMAKAVARQVFRVLPQAKTIALSQMRPQFTRGNFSAAEMSASVEQSLRELRTDYIDVLFLHQCGPDVIDDDQLFRGLEELIQAGKVRHCGIASSAAVIALGVQKRRSQISAVQFHQNLLAQGDARDVAAEPAAKGVGTMAHQPFGGPEGIGTLRRELDRLQADTVISPVLRAKLEVADARLLADLALNGVLRNTGIDVAVCAMYNTDHIRANAAVVGNSRFSPEEIREIQQYLDSPRIAK